MKVLVTGAAGFISSHIVKNLLENDDVYVTALDDLSGGFQSNLPGALEGCQFVQMDINDPAIDALFEEKQFDYVYHLAAYAAEGLSHFIRKYNYTNNVVGSMNLINASIKHGVKCFVFASSIATYGHGISPVTEESPQIPADPYGIAKLAVELDLKAAHEMFGLNYIVFRPHNVFGTNQNIGDKYRNVVGIFLNQIMQNKPLTIFGDGQQTRAFSYIDDIAPVIAGAVHNETMYNQAFNIGADRAYSLNELADLLIAVLKDYNKELEYTIPITYLEARNEVQHISADHSKLKAIVGDYEKTVMYQGLLKMVRWAFDVGPRETSKFKNIEIEKNLPKSWQ